MIHVLLAYSLEKQTLLSSESFDDVVEAMKAYSAAERDHVRSRDVEIVLIGADSVDTIMTTHSSYFEGDVTVGQLDLDTLLS